MNALKLLKQTLLALEKQTSLALENQAPLALEKHVARALEKHAAREKYTAPENVLESNLENDKVKFRPNFANYRDDVKRGDGRERQLRLGWVMTHGAAMNAVPMMGYGAVVGIGFDAALATERRGAVVGIGCDAALATERRGAAAPPLLPMNSSNGEQRRSRVLRC
jgi:hypothetical protein